MEYTEREKEILLDVLDAHLETLDERVNDGETELQEERGIVEALPYRIREEA